MEKDKYLGLVMAFVMFVIGMEYIIARSRGKRKFRFQNTISNLMMGAFDRIAGLFIVPLIYFYYDFLYKHLAIFEFQESTLVFLIAILVSDFIWYFYHKAGHRINVFWGAHIVHHQSEDYNYSVALNLTPLQVLLRILFWSLMPIFGFTSEFVLGTHLVIGLYQFLLHTTLIPKLGIIEWVFVTPSHHRVHHGSNEEYLDKNYGGVLIIWDRIFGTFKEEEAEVVYGLTKDINSKDFLTSVFHYYFNLRFQMRQLPKVKDKFRLLIKGPDWIPESGPLKHLPLYVTKGSSNYFSYSLLHKIYVVLNTCILFIVLGLFSYYFESLSNTQIFISCTWVFITLMVLGRLLENKRVVLLETLRILCFFGFLSALYY
ncbi:MAG: sterol desaturase family protein [Flavicella sp.]